MKRIVLIVQIIFLVYFIYAEVINVPADFQTIQTGLNAAGSGDTVLVQPGVYYENIIWPEIHGIKLISAGDTSNTVVDGNYSGTVIYFQPSFNYDSATIIKGFKITHGSESGIYMTDANILLENLLIRENTGFIYFESQIGGGVVCYYSSPVIRGCKICKNNVSGFSAAGGGVYLSDFSSPDFTNVEISDNTCNALSYAMGGGIYFENHCNPVFKNVSISRNIIEGENCQGAGVYCKIFCVTTFEKSKINHNVAMAFSDNRGGGIYCYLESILYLTQCYITDNRFSGTAASNLGTGIFCLSTQFAAVNCLIALNSVSEDIYDFDGVGIYAAMSGPVSIINSTIAGNYRENYTIATASGIMFADIYGGLKNSIFWNENLSEEIDTDILSEITVSYSAIKGGWPGTGNIEDNPLFVDDSTFIIHPDSPCINTGTDYGAPSVDILGNPRPMPIFTNPDMGAYEVDQTVSVETNSTDNNINVYPNPLNSTAVIQFNNYENGFSHFQLYDAFGKLVKDFRNISGNKILFQRGMLPPGDYLGKLIRGKNKFDFIKIIIL